MIEVASVELMRVSDAAEIERGTPGIRLMQTAALAVADSVDFIDPVAVVCGTGNNAGDGYALALLLHERKIPVTVFLAVDRFSADGRHFFNECRSRGIDIKNAAEVPDFSGYKTVVDCLLGTGFTGEVKEDIAAVIDKINASKAFVVSVDINSGLNGGSGQYKTCVKSDLTVSVGAFKPGHFLGGAKDVMRKKVNRDIGIPLIDTPCYLLEKSDVKAALGTRKHNTNKGDYGYIALIAGSVPYSGAAKLSNMAASAMRAGAGVVRLAVPQSVAPAVAPYLLESTLFVLLERGGEYVFDKAETDNLTAKTKAVAAGMGLTHTHETEKLVAHLLATYRGTLILDADALNALAVLDQSLLKNAVGRVVLTPHPLEFSRLSALSVAEILADPIGTARAYAKAHRVTVLLKGTATVITDGERVYLTDTGCAGMATAGSGDVLSGILAAVCGFSHENLPLAVAAGAYINGRAGELAQRKTNAVSMTAGDTALSVAAAITEILC